MSGLWDKTIKEKSKSHEEKYIFVPHRTCNIWKIYGSLAAGMQHLER